MAELGLYTAGFSAADCGLAGVGFFAAD